MDVIEFIKNISFPFNLYFPEDLEPDDNGLVALGGELNVLILIEAYSKGIFPWTGANPIPWYSPAPRLVLYPHEFHVSKSFKKKLKNEEYTVKYDNDFTSVIKNCAVVKRKNQNGTWITSNMLETYTELFHLHIVHCIEVYHENDLCGGLYGLSLGKTFFGESMFNKRSNYSKIALYYLTKKLIELGINMIDCQQSTPHLKSMGATEIPREEFLNNLRLSLQDGINIKKW